MAPCSRAPSARAPPSHTTQRRQWPPQVQSSGAGGGGRGPWPVAGSPEVGRPYTLGMFAPLLLAATACAARGPPKHTVCTGSRTAGSEEPGWCTHYNCTADPSQPVLEGQLFRFFPLPNSSFDGGLMAWEEHNVAPLAGDVTFACVDSAYTSWARGGNTLISWSHFRWSTAYGQYAWCRDGEPGSCRYSGGGTRVGNVNPFGPWTQKGADRGRYPGHSCNLTTNRSTCPSCPVLPQSRRGGNRWYNLTTAQKLQLTQQCDVNITTGAWFSLEAVGKCRPGQHVDAAHPPSNQPGGGCAWEWLPAAGVTTIEVACLNRTGFFRACADAQLVPGYGCAYARAAALFRRAILACPNVTAKFNLRYKADDTADSSSRRRRRSSSSSGGGGGVSATVPPAPSPRVVSMWWKPGHSGQTAAADVASMKSRFFVSDVIIYCGVAVLDNGTVGFDPAGPGRPGTSGWGAPSLCPAAFTAAAAAGMSMQVVLEARGSGIQRALLRGGGAIGAEAAALVLGLDRERVVGAINIDFEAAALPLPSSAAVNRFTEAFAGAIRERGLRLSVCVNSRILGAVPSSPLTAGSVWKLFEMSTYHSPDRSSFRHTLVDDLAAYNATDAAVLRAQFVVGLHVNANEPHASGWDNSTQGVAQKFQVLRQQQVQQVALFVWPVCAPGVRCTPPPLLDQWSSELGKFVSL
jgi:hypothetical protein